jgi:hypothetical protein
MESAFCRWLESSGGEIISRSEGRRGGPDVVANYRGKEIVFELKTDRPKGEGRRTDERGVDYPTVVGQIVMRMNTPEREYAIVVTDKGLDWIKRHYAPYAWERTGIRLFTWNGERATELLGNYSPPEQI